MANTKKAPGKERSTAEVEAAVKEMETQSVKDSTKEAAAGEKDSAKKNTVKKGSMKKAAAYAEETELGANAADKAEEDTTEVKPKLTGKLDEKMIASLPASTIIQASEKLRDLLIKGRKKGKLDSAELSEVLDDMDLESDQMDSIYDTLELLGIDTAGDDYLPEPIDDADPPLEEITEIEEEELSIPIHWWITSASTIPCACI